MVHARYLQTILGIQLLLENWHLGLTTSCLIFTIQWDSLFLIFEILACIQILKTIGALQHLCLNLTYPHKIIQKPLYTPLSSNHLFLLYIGLAEPDLYHMGIRLISRSTSSNWFTDGYFIWLSFIMSSKSLGSFNVYLSSGYIDRSQWKVMLPNFSINFLLNTKSL